jgi:hypothetical protein
MNPLSGQPGFKTGAPELRLLQCPGAYGTPNDANER